MAQTPADRRRAQRRLAKDAAAGRHSAASNLARISRRATVKANSKFMYGDPASDPKRAASLGSKAMLKRLSGGELHPEAEDGWEAIGEEFYYHDKPV